jgi:hypothetical protein
MAVVLACFDHRVGAQTEDPALEQRVTQLENYVETFDSTMMELSNNLNQSIQEYTRGLEASLEDYSTKLQQSIDERLNTLDKKTVVLNPYARSFQSLETNSGVFFIAVESVETIDNGFRLHLNIGNPHYVDFQNFKLKFFWGPPWAGSHVIAYNEWRGSLNGAEFSFQGKIEKGMWNAVSVDLIAMEGGDLSYLECEMSVSGVELGYQ